MNIQIFIKRDLARFPRDFGEMVPNFEEMLLMSAESIEVVKEPGYESRREYGMAWYHPPGKYIAVIERFRMSPRFILVDLEAPEKRLKKYRRCGFSTRKYNNSIGGSKK